VGDGAALLDISHLPHTGCTIQHVVQSAARHSTRAIQEVFKYPQINMLEILKSFEKKTFSETPTCVFSTSLLSSKEQKSDEKRMT
jgi:hypothetical protein